MIFVAWPRTPDVVRSGPLCFHHINAVLAVSSLPRDFEGDKVDCGGRQAEVRRPRRRPSGTYPVQAILSGNTPEVVTCAGFCGF